jgi:hypothetical protein
LLRYVDAGDVRVGGGGILKTIIVNDSLHETSKDNLSRHTITLITSGQIKDSIQHVMSNLSEEATVCHNPSNAEVRMRLSVSKQRLQKFDMRRFNLKKLNKVEEKEQYQVKICSNGKVT